MALLKILECKENLTLPTMKINSLENNYVWDKWLCSLVQNEPLQIGSLLQPRMVLTQHGLHELIVVQQSDGVKLGGKGKIKRQAY